VRQLGVLFLLVQFVLRALTVFKHVQRRLHAQQVTFVVKALQPQLSFLAWLVRIAHPVRHLPTLTAQFVLLEPTVIKAQLIRIRVPRAITALLELSAIPSTLVQLGRTIRPLARISPLIA